MALFDNILEIKKHNSAISTVELSNIQSFIDDAINSFIITHIGLEQFDALISAKPTLAENSKEYRLLFLLQKAATGHLIANYADNGAVTIGNTGISVAKTEKSLPASDKKLMLLKRSNLKAAYQAIELAIIYLEANLDDFPIYKASDEHKANRSLLINTSKEFQEAGVNIRQDARLFFSLKTYIANATENIIAPLLPEAQLEALHQRVLDHTETDFDKKLLAKISKPVAAMAMVEAIPYRVVTIDADGVFELSETVGGISGNVENRQTISERRLNGLMMELRMRADQELVSLTNFINKNATQLGITVETPTNINDGSAPNIYFF